MKTAVLTLVLGLGLGLKISVQAETYDFPWQKGMEWTYAAQVDWTAKNTSPTVVRSAEITCKITVVDTCQTENFRAARLHGFMTDMAWYDPDKAASDNILLQIGPNHLFHLTSDIDQLWQKLAAGKFDGIYDLLDKAELLFELPLTANARWGGDPFNQISGRYCWIVEGGPMPFDLSSVKGAPPLAEPRRFSLAYLTTPDDTHIDFVPGLGIVGYAYHHHGTTANAAVRLIQYKP